MMRRMLSKFGLKHWSKATGSYRFQFAGIGSEHATHNHESYNNNHNQESGYRNQDQSNAYTYMNTRNLRESLLMAAILFAMELTRRLSKDAQCEESTKSISEDQLQSEIGVHFETGQTLTNWSNTHSCDPKRVFEPRSAQEVSRVIRKLSDLGEKIRPVGTALSPNGIAMSNGNVLSLANLDYIEVDKAKMNVTVGAGATVCNVLKELSKYNLTLENFSSIQEQQMGGWTQVSAHGTGCSLSTVDGMILRMKLATPYNGILTLSPTTDPSLFSMAKVGLGSLGVVTELTMACVPQFKLAENSLASTFQSVANGHTDRLSSYRHVRHMWLPFADTVIVVVSNPTDAPPRSLATVTNANNEPITQPLVHLLLETQPSFDRAKAQTLSFSQLRDLLLDADPLNLEYVKKVNKAEAAYWSEWAGSGGRVADSTEILGFDCGGEQMVFEVCFPLGTIKENQQAGYTDLTFVKKLLALIEKEKIPAPCPIEQRWSARSTSPISPAFSEKKDEIFSWVGVILYLPPSQTPEQRKKIEKEFRRYKRVMQPLLDEYKAHCHWAKIELPRKEEEGKEGKEEDSLDHKALETMRRRIAERYNVEGFNNYRKVLDPKSVLSNDLIDRIFGED